MVLNQGRAQEKYVQNRITYFSPRVLNVYEISNVPMKRSSVSIFLGGDLTGRLFYFFTCVRVQHQPDKPIVMIKP